MGEAVWAWLGSTAGSMGGVRWAWTWALLEAIVLPLPPELLLIPLAVAHPARALAFSVAATIGSLMGGSVMFLLGRLIGERAVALLTRLPGVGEGRMLVVASRLKRFGVRFIAWSPWLMLPYKITSLLSGHLRVRWWRYLIAGIIGRGTRLATTTLSAAGLATMVEKWGQTPSFVTVFAAYAVIGCIIWVIRRRLWGRFAA